LSNEPDFEGAIIDGTIVRVRQKGSGARGGLKIRPSADRAAVWRPRSWRGSMPSAIWRTSFSWRASDDVTPAPVPTRQ
jgi:hypothetical protein